MSYQLFWKQVAFGLVLWIVPFVTGFFFVSPDGTFVISETFFKSIMVAVSSFTGVILLDQYFNAITTHYFRQGLQVGLTWMVLNWLLDLSLVMTGFFDETIVSYFQNIGLRYLAILFYAVGFGFALSRLEKRLISKMQSEEN